MIARLTFLLCCCSLLLSCTPIGMLTTIGTTAGSFAMEERGFEGATRDMSLKADIIATWAGQDLSYTTGLGVIVYNGKAMVFGTVDTEEQRSKAIETVWKVDGITDVFNEIVLKADTSLEDFAHDTWIDTRLSASLAFDGQIMHINYKFDTEGGTVYVIGLAQSKGELRRFINHAKSISYVRKVVSHVDVKQRQSLFRSQKTLATVNE